jgi:competence protein ComEA
MKKLLLIATSVLALSVFASPSFAKTSSEQVVLKTATKEKLDKINLNSAGAKEIAEALTGVGMKKAQAIVEYRQSHGKFNKIEELANVKGIGVATLAKNESRIVFQ